jgi:transmembrane sensor
MDSSQRLQELFARYLRRDATAQEVQELVTLLRQADAEKALSEQMRTLWEDLKTENTEYLVDWDKMYGRVSEVGEGPADRQAGFRIGWRYGYRAIAAVFVLLAGTAVYISIRMGGGPGVHPVAALQPSVVNGPVVTVTARVTDHVAAEERKRVVHLPDGSTVILNRHSTLDYPRDISGGREVTLSGEAYFDIVHRTGQPFLVHTGKIVTKVLGTAFNVKAYPGEDAIEVTVDHGKVQVLKGRSNMGLLTDNQQMRYNKGTEGHISQAVNIKPVMAWKPEEVVFDDLTMEEAARRIGQRFNVTVSFANPVVKECRVTATFYQEDELDEIMTVICAVSQSNFVIKGNTIVIDGKGCN